MTKTYAQIAREIAALQATADKLYAVEIKSAVAKVNELISKYGLSADDLRFGGATAASKPAASASVASGKRRAKGASSSSAAAASSAKYSDGQGGVWGGRGPRPAWLRSAIAAGRSLESFLVAGAADVVAALTKPMGGSRGKAKARMPVATGVAKYVNPKTGAGWSGRGPRPQWLKDALKKRGSKIEDFLGANDAPAKSSAVAAAAPSRVAAKKMAAKTSASTSKSSSTKTPSRKIVSKKSVGKKAASRQATAVSAPASPVRKAPSKAASTKAVPVQAKKAALSQRPSKKAAATKVPTSNHLAKAPAAVVPGADMAAPSANA